MGSVEHWGTTMGDLFRLWNKRIDHNARRAVDAYQEELAEYRRLAAQPRTRAEMLDFAVFLRRRTVALAADHAPFEEIDLQSMAAMGRQRGERGLTLTGQRQVLLLHTRLTLLEIYESTGAGDIETTMNALAWLAPAGLAAQSAFARGWVEGQQFVLSTAAQARLLVSMLLADDGTAGDLARALHMPIPERMLAVVIRIAGAGPVPDQDARDGLLADLVVCHRVPIAWADPGEVVALMPSDAEKTLHLVRDAAALIGRPCAAGTATGRRPGLADAVELARQVARVAPLRSVPQHAYAVTDVFAELGAPHVPRVERWLESVGRKLASGPDLVATLDVFYRLDMNRLNTASALRIHPRTLDYRLSRVRALTGLAPGSTRGVRILSTVVARILAADQT